MRPSSGSIIFGGFYSPPFMNYDEKGALRGPLIELASNIAEYFHFIPTFSNMSQEQLNSFPNASIDVGLGVFETAFRRKLGYFSYPLMQFGLQGLSFTYYSAKNLDDLIEKKLKFGVQEGDVGHNFLLENCGTNWVSKFCEVI